MIIRAGHALLAAILMALIIFAPCTSVAYAADGAVYEIMAFEATYSVNADCTIGAEEILTIYFTQSGQYFIRELYANDEGRIYDVEVARLDEYGNETDAECSVELEGNNIVLDIDGANHAEETATFVIRYVYVAALPSSGDEIVLNIAGFGGTNVNAGNVTINLPDGFENAELYIDGAASDRLSRSGDALTVDLTDETFEAAKIRMSFESGTLTAFFDIMPYVMTIVGLAVLAVLAAVKFLAFPKKKLTPATADEPPQDIDPVEASKLTDNKVSSADATMLILYWAVRGYINIDLTDSHDPVLIRTGKELPLNAPKHQTVLFNALFMRRNRVRTSELEGNFYTNIERVKKLVNEKHSGLYTNRSVCVSLIFTLLGGLIMALAPIVTGIACITSALFYYPAFLAIVPAFAAYGAAESYIYSIYKLKGGMKALIICGIVALCAAFTCAYMWLIPSAIMAALPEVLTCATAYAIIAVSVTLITRTDSYSERLNAIMGLRKYMAGADRDELQAKTDSGRDIYFELLPYARVTGVCDIWEKKFKELNTDAPPWLTVSGKDFEHMVKDLKIGFAVITAKMVLPAITGK